MSDAPQAARMIDRRSFLRGLVAAAVATQLPSMPSAKADTAVDRITSGLMRVMFNGQGPHSISIADAGHGWCHVRACFGSESGDKRELDLTGMSDGRGLQICSPESEAEARRMYPNDIIMRAATIGTGAQTIAFTCLVKVDGDEQRIAWPQLHVEPDQSEYIQTTSTNFVLNSNQFRDD